MHGITKKQASDHTALSEQRRNTVLLAVLLCAVFGGGLLFFHLAHRAEGLCAVIEQYGVELKRLPLSRDAVLEVPSEDGGYNLVEVEGGTVRVREADCPNQTCVQTGAIRYPGEVIACVPHRLVITISQE